MVIRSTLFIVLYAVFLSQTICGQDTTDVSTDFTTDETTSIDTTEAIITTTTTIETTTPSPSCRYPEEFPLFNDNTCISRTAYTAIFLTSIILAGLSFLMLIALSILCCTRKSKNSRASDNEYNGSSAGRKPVPSTNSSMNGGGVLYSIPEQSASADTTRFERARTGIASSSSFNNHNIVVEKRITPSSAPYTDSEPVPNVVTRTGQANGKQKPPEYIEMNSRVNNKKTANPPRSMPSSTPKTTTDLDDYRDSNRSSRVSSNGDPQTTNF